jgi:hypothetical protein
MSRHSIKNQAVLIAVGKGEHKALLGMTPELAPSFESYSWHPDDVFSCEDDIPKEPGLYVWEGDFDHETGGWAGSEPVDPDYWFCGEFRPATAADLTRFGVVLSPIPEASQG